MRKPGDAKTRFMSHVTPVTETGCWFWLAKIDRHGYGEMWLNRKGVKAHRASYELFNGAVPESKSVLHSCDIRCCVNPNHLFLGTPRDNSDDMVKKNRQAAGSRHGRAILTEQDAKDIFEAKDGLAELSKKYGVSTAAIWQIKTGGNWKKVTIDLRRG